MKLNETTRMYSRTIHEAFPSTIRSIEQRRTWNWWEEHQDEELTFKDSQFWVYITLSFASGFLVCHLWG